MIDKIKKNWKNILIALLVLFGLNKCTVACNRASKIKQNTEIIDSLSNLTNEQIIIIDKLETDTANYINQIRMYKTFDLKRDAQDSINNANLAAQKAQTDKLIQQNRNLMKRK